ncbi:30S ribosomal protein S18 [Deinococcus sp.]|uniref:30S ribosomal protein S18 n=1 Tax=Deinococcus sp. TaxID=47478 RepID=UPI003B59807A
MTQTDRDRKPRGKGPKRPRKPKVDPFSIGELEITDYKDVKMLRRFVSDTGKILPRRRTGLSAKHQRRIAQTIKLARQLALLPYTEKLVRK